MKPVRLLLAALLLLGARASRAGGPQERVEPVSLERPALAPAAPTLAAPVLAGGDALAPLGVGMIQLDGQAATATAASGAAVENAPAAAAPLAAAGSFAGVSRDAGLERGRTGAARPAANDAAWSEGARRFDGASAEPEAAVRAPRTVGERARAAVSLTAATGLTLFAFDRHMTADQRAAHYHAVAVQSHHQHVWTWWELVDLGWLNDFITIPAAVAMCYLGYLAYTALSRDEVTRSAARREKAWLVAGISGLLFLSMSSEEVNQLGNGATLDPVDLLAYLTSALLTIGAARLLWWPRNASPARTDRYDPSTHGFNHFLMFGIWGALGAALHVLGMFVFWKNYHTYHGFLDYGWWALALFAAFPAAALAVVYRKRRDLVDG